MTTPRFSSYCQVSLLIVIALVVPADGSAQKKGGAAAASTTPTAASAPGGSASSAPVEVEWLAYSSLDKVLDKLSTFTCGQSVAKTDGAKVVILDPPAIQALQAYDSFYAQAESLIGAFTDMAPTSGAGGSVDDFADITGAVSAAAVASTSETSSSFTIQDPTAAIVLLGKLRKSTNPASCKSAYYAGIYTLPAISKRPKNVDAQLYKAPPADASAEDKEAKLTKQADTKKLLTVPEELDALATARRQTLLTILGTIKNSSPFVCRATPTLIAGMNQPAAQAQGAIQPARPQPGAPATPTAISAQDPCVTAFNNLDATYNSFLTALSTPNSTTGQQFVSAAKQGYYLRALLKGATDQAPVLGIYLSMAASGGTQQDRKNLLTAVFTGDWIRYSGGVSVNIIVFEEAGKGSKNSQVLFADLVRFRTPLTTINAPSDKSGLNAGDNLEVFNSKSEATPQPDAATATPQH